MRSSSRTYAVLLALLLLAALPRAVHAAMVGISPASANATVGDTLLLTVGVDQVSDLGGFQFGINYDPAALSINSMTVNSGFDLPVKNQFDNGSGKGSVAASVFSSPTLSGVGLPLAVISFNVKSSGTTSVGLVNVILGRVGGAEIPSTSVGAVVSAVPGVGPPIVTLVSPLNGATLVPVNAAVIASFSVPMNGSTINDSSFFLTGPTGTVGGSVLASGQTASFTPSQALVNGATYTATITTGVQDLAGSGLTANYTWSFTTVPTTHTITATAGANGSITPSGTVVVNDGNSQTFTITPNANYSIGGVLVDLVSVGSVTSYTFTNVTADHTISANFSFICPTISLSPASLPTGTQGSVYSQSIVASGGTGTYSYAVTAGTLPAGSMLVSDGTITGTMTAVGTYNFTVTATDANACTGSQVYTVTVNSSNCVAPPTGLVSSWKAEGNALDQTGLNNGSLVSGVSYTTGKVGQAFNFDWNNSQYVAVPDSPSLNVTTQFTLEAWINPVSVPDASGAGIISKVGGGVSSHGYQMGMNPAGQLFCSFNSTGDPWPNPTSSVTAGSVPFGSWSHVACTYDNNTLMIYVNGAPVASSVAGPKTVASTTYTLRLSGDDNSHVYFSGSIDEASVFSRALTPGEVLAVYNAGSYGFCDTPPMVMAVTPVNGAASVPRNTAIAATFSEAMLASSLTATTFFVSGPSGTVAGGIAVSGATATFTPSASLASGATYTATITTGAKDLAGNGLSANYTWSLTTLTTNFTITATAGVHGTITPSGAVTVNEGSSQFFSIVPSAGYSVATVTVDSIVSLGSVTVYTFPSVSADHTISASFVDNIAPTGSIMINGGALATNLATVSLALTCSDAGSGCSQAIVSDGTSTQVYSIGTSTTALWTLTGADGAKSVSVRFNDADNNQSLSVLGTITLDRIAPATSATPLGGTYPANQSVTLTASELSTIYFTLDGADPLLSSPTYTAPLLVTSGTTTLKFFAVDLAGNAEVFQTQVYIVDLNAPLISNVTPTTGAFINTADVRYTLNKLMTSGSVVFTRTSGTTDQQSPHAHSMIGSELTAGPHSVSTGLTLVDGVVYSVAFQASDGAVSAPTVTSTNVTYDTTAVLITITSPGVRTNTAAMGYVLSEPTTTGQIVISDGITQPFVYPLSAADLTAGPHTVNTGATLVNNGVYDFSLVNMVDRAGNIRSATVSGVVFDLTAVAISNTLPATKSIITSPTVTYTLSEQAASGAVTFTRTGGAADPASPRVYTMTVSDLTQTTHTVTPPLTLVDGAFYTVSFAATDMAGNAAPTVSNALIYFDSRYDPALPGNVDNTGPSTNIVDNADVRKLERSLGTRPGDQHWNPVCDLDRNNIIDARDLMILRSHQAGQ